MRSRRLNSIPRRQSARNLAQHRLAEARARYKRAGERAREHELEYAGGLRRAEEAQVRSLSAARRLAPNTAPCG